MQTDLNYVNKTPSAIAGLSVKKKEEMSLKKSPFFACVFTDSSYNHKN